jgi:F-type H+-transporting ATPase subunit gamma
MANLKETKRRIISVNNTQKITRAMKLVSSAKYAKSQGRLSSFTSYQEKFKELLSTVAQTKEHLLLKKSQESGKKLLIVISSDRGLCGPLNTNVLREVERFLENSEFAQSWELEVWGKKAQQFAKKREEKIVFSTDKVSEHPDFEFARSSFMRFYQGLLSKRYRKIYLAYPQFKNVMSQPPVIKEILPLEKLMKSIKPTKGEAVLEPEGSKMLEPMLISYGTCFLYGVLLEVGVAENAARMTAMDSATNNADKVIKELTLEYNRARQAAITKELIEITSGVEALG